MLFDFSGTLFRLEEDDSWFDGITVDEKAVDGHVQAELMRRVTAPTGSSVPMSEEQQHNWANRDLEPHLHREAYLHVLRESGLTGADAAALYPKLVDPASWTPYPDTAAALNGLRAAGVKTAVVSNIAFDLRPALGRPPAPRPTSTCCPSRSARSSRTRRSFETALNATGCRARRCADGR